MSKMLVALLLIAIIPAVVPQLFGYQPYQFQRNPAPYAYNPFVNPYSNYGYRRPTTPRPAPTPFRYSATITTSIPPTALASTASNMGTLPFGMYDNFVCNKIAGRTRRKRDVIFQRVFGPYIQPVAVTAYNQLLPFIARNEQNEVWHQIKYLTMEGIHPEMIVKAIVALRLNRAGEYGNVNDIYNAMGHLSTTPDKVYEETQTRAGAAVCTTTNAFYCNYINKLQKSAPYCGSAALSNQLYQQCCINNPFTTLPSPVPSVYARPTPPPQPPAQSGSAVNSDPENCGISDINPAAGMGPFSQKINQMRIVGGVRADRCEYPWMVRLRLGSSVCGGSIIDEWHVVTAAHCVKDYSASGITVHAGEYNANNPYESQDRAIQSASVIRHPDYRELPDGSQENDIAVIKLATRLNLNSSCIRPICLAKDGDGVSLAPGTQCTTAGWGTIYSGGPASPELLETTIPTYSGADCKTAFTRTVPSNPSIQLCAGRPIFGGADTCQGDSGGPLFCPVNGRYVQYGVVSYGAGCASAGAAGVYTNVGKMRDFIDRVRANSYGK